MKPIKKILIVCTGNSCRSAMAEGYLKKKLKDADIHSISVISSGTGGIPGLSPTDEAIQVMKEQGIDISGHISKGLNRLHIDSADIILVMSPHHREKILDIAPDAEDKIHYLRKFSSEKDRNTNAIKDPIGRPVELYREVFEIIKDSIEGFIKWLKE